MKSENIFQLWEECHASTVSFNDEAIRRLRHVSLANAMLRHRFGYHAKTCKIRGPAYWSKTILQRALQNSSWVQRERARHRIVDFRLDAADPSGIVDLAAVE